MAFVSQEDKKTLAPGIKAVLKKYKMKGTISVKNHSTLCVSLKSGQLDLLGAAQKSNDRIAEREGRPSYQIGDYLQVNHYWCEENSRIIGEEEIADFYSELISAMEGPDFFNNDDAMSDYFHRSHYIDIDAGRFQKPYMYEAA
tara:strand:- start:5089 stop:5517 length:429 start_codon:yes stop_codon:yes gene_type:complete